MKPWMRYALVALAGLVLGIVIAKYTLPPKTITKTETKVQVVEKIVYRDNIVKEQGPVRIVTKTTTVPGPAGPTVTVEKVVEKEKIVTVTVREGASATDTKVSEKTSKTVDNRPVFALSGLGGIDLSSGRWAFSGDATVRLFGPVWIGAGAIKADTWYFGPAARIEF
jgi:hypothetical protein